MKAFYRLAHTNETMELTAMDPPDALVENYRRKGLKKGDALIGAFCEWQHISFFVSENRHFLVELNDSPYEVVDAEALCQKFKLDKLTP